MYDQYKPPFNFGQVLFKGLLFTLPTFIFYCTYLVIAWIIGYSWIALVVVLWLVFRFLKVVGLFVMFPGSFKYYRGSIESSVSKAWRKRILLSTESVRKMVERANSKKENTNNLGPCMYSWAYLMNTIKNHDKNIRPLKKRLLQSMSSVLSIYENHLKDLESQISEQQIQVLQPVFKSLEDNLKEIETVLSIYKPPVGSIHSVWHDIYSQKLYKLEYGFGFYETRYHYQRRRVSDLDLVIFSGHKDLPIIQHRDIVLFCHPNGAFLEQFASDCKYVDFYLEEKLHVCLWNYRGYSESKGSPSLSNNEEDVVKVYDTLRSQGYNPVVVHGYSIGGLIAIHLAQARKVDLLIVDRTLSGILQISKEYGQVLALLSRVVFWKDQKDYARKFYDLSIQKVMINDPYDDVIVNGASLKTGVSKLCVSELRQRHKGGVVMVEAEQNMDTLLTARLVKHSVTQEERQYALLNDKFAQALLWNSMPFANHRVPQHRAPIEVAVDKAVEEMRFCLQQVSHFSSMGIGKVQQAPHAIKQLFQNFSFPDSALLTLPTLSIKSLQKMSQSSLLSEVYSYINGLIVYGTVLNRDVNILNPIGNRLQTIKSIYSLYRHLLQCETSSSDDLYFSDIIHNLASQYAFMAVFIYDTLQEVGYKKAGLLIPTDRGHNGDLTQSQFHALRQLLRSDSYIQPI